MYDVVGGGFHRYSTDDAWLVPHFEKMLYDNAQLALAYLQAGNVEQAKSELAQARSNDPDYAPAYLAAYSVLYEGGQRERGLQILEQWVNPHPDDAQARALLDMRRRELGIAPGTLPSPPPSMPNLP